MRQALAPSSTNEGNRPDRRVFLSALLAASAVAAFFFWTNVRAIDFGRHWDERPILRDVQHAVASGSGLPRRYIYPTLHVWLTEIRGLPLLFDLLQSEPTDKPLRVRWSRAMGEPAFLLSLRTMISAVSALTVLIVFATGWILFRRPWPAFAAAAVTGLSWELAYHSRWFTVDPLLAHAGSWVLLWGALYHKKRRAVYLIATAIAAGLAMGAKYPGGAFLLPIVIAVRFYAEPGRDFWRQLALFALLPFTLTFLLTTPGLVIEPFNSLPDIRRMWVHYLDGTHRGQTIGRGLPHLISNLQYILFAAPSRFFPLCLIVSGAAIVGIKSVASREAAYATFLLSFLIFYIGYFSAGTVMIARNFLVVIPVLALLVGAGYFEIERRTGDSRTLYPRLLLIILVGVNGWWLFHASESIRRTDDRAAAHAIRTHLKENPATSFALSYRVRRLLLETGAVPVNARRRPNPDRVVFFSREAVRDYRAERWSGTTFGTVSADFGPYVANRDYYPTFLRGGYLALPADVVRTWDLWKKVW